MRGRLRELLAVAVGGAVAAAAFSLWLAARGGVSARYEASGWELGVVFAGTALLIWGVRSVARSGGWSAALPTFALASLALVSLLSLFSLGPLVLLVAVGLGVIAISLMRRGRSARAQARIGAVLALGPFLIVLAALQPPTVECGPLGPRTYFGTGASALITVADDRRFGELRDGDSLVRFACEGERLVRFERSSR